MSQKSNTFRRVVTIALLGGGVLLLVAASAMAIDPPPTVGPNARVNDPLGPDGADFPGTLIGCLNDPDCDDDPKAQNETAITVAPWDPNLLIAAWNDRSHQYLDQQGNGAGRHGMGFAISDDGGSTWLRFDHGLNPCNMTCDPFDPIVPPGCFVEGNSLTLDDIGVDTSDPGNPCFAWFDDQGDPSTSAGGFPGGDKYLYLAGLDLNDDVFFARLRWQNPVTGWEPAEVPPATSGDKPYMTADPLSEDIYVYWGGQAIFLTASRCAGCDFIDPNPPPPVVARRLAFDPQDAPIQSQSATGAVAAVGPLGDFNIIWWQANGATPQPSEDRIDQIRYRRGEWNHGGVLEFDPVLPQGLGSTCIEDTDCATPIVFGQPGFEAGFRPLWIPFFPDSLVSRSTNFAKLGSFPAIAVDRSGPDDDCGRGGTIYVTYAAEELPGGVTTDPEVCDTTRTVDSNIYLVRGRVSTVDQTITWSAPSLVRHTFIDPACYDSACLPPCQTCVLRIDQEESVTCGDEPGEESVVCGRHSPFQLHPWIAVDEEGRVGVMYFDTTLDNTVDLPEIGNRCDENVVYRVQFTYSLDGGVTWAEPITVSEANSETSPNQEFFPIPNIFMGEYEGMSATSIAGNGKFDPIWTDLREWGADDLELEEFGLTPGDIYTSRVTVGAAVYSMGDYNRDGDVDANDYAFIAVCDAAGLPLPPLCEILDFDRDGDVDKSDATAFYAPGGCFTGGGSSPLTGMGDWSVEVMTPFERAQLADVILDASQTVAQQEAQVMQDYAEIISPQ